MLVNPITNGIPVKEATRMPEIQYFFWLVRKINAKIDWMKLRQFGIKAITFLQLSDNLKLHNLWLMAHMNTIAGTLGCLKGSLTHTSYDSFCFSLAVHSMIFTYAIVVYRQINCLQTLSTPTLTSPRQKEGFTFLKIIMTENFYLLVLSLLSSTSSVNTLKLCSFALYSLLNLSDYICKTYQHWNLIVSASPFLEYLEAPLLQVAAWIDFCVAFVYFYEGVSLRNFSGFLLYGFIFLLRLENSGSIQGVLTEMVLLFDNLIIRGLNNKVLSIMKVRIPRISRPVLAVSFQQDL